jgi:hypothetical protein
MDEQILRSAKEITVKFIEVGRVSPQGFPEIFRTIYSAILDAVQNPSKPEDPSQK